MTRAPEPAPAPIMAGMKPLPRRHRIAHLRALVRQRPVRSVRREELGAVLRDEMTAQLAASAASKMM